MNQRNIALAAEQAEKADKLLSEAMTGSMTFEIGQLACDIHGLLKEARMKLDTLLYYAEKECKKCVK